MTWNDLTPNQQLLMQALHFAGEGASKMELVEATGMTDGQIGPLLSRMKQKGWILMRLLQGNTPPVWCLTSEGLALWATQSPSSAPPVALPEPAPAPAEEPARCSVPDPIAADILLAMEIEQALDLVRNRLRVSLLPARATRIYRELLASLPKPLVEGLVPLTGVVDALQ